MALMQMGVVGNTLSNSSYEYGAALIHTDGDTRARPRAPARTGTIASTSTRRSMMVSMPMDPEIERELRALLGGDTQPQPEAPAPAPAGGRGSNAASLLTHAGVESPTKAATEAASEAFSSFLNAFQEEDRFEAFESDLKECDQVVTVISKNETTENAEQVLNDILLDEAAVLMEADGYGDAGPAVIMGTAGWEAGLDPEQLEAMDPAAREELLAERAEQAEQRRLLAARQQAIASQQKAQRAELAELQRLRKAEEERLERRQARDREELEDRAAKARAELEREQAEAEAAMRDEVQTLEQEMRAEKEAREALTSAAMASERAKMQTIELRKQEIAAEHQQRRAAAAVTLQSHFRGRRGRATYRKLQAADRERKRIAKLADEQRRFAAIAKATRKQEAEEARLEQERQELEARRQRQQQELEARQNGAAVVLQSMGRQWLARRALQQLRTAAQRNAAAVVLQSLVRGNMARQRCERQRAEARRQEEQALLEEAERLAAHHRAEAARARAELERQKEDARLEQALREERERQQRQAAEAEAQRLRLEREASQAEELRLVQDFAATTVQAAWRGFEVRRRLFLEREVFGPAAVMIQACWRGHRVRTDLERIRTQALFEDEDDFDYDVEIDLADLDFDENQFDDEFEVVPPTPQPPEATQTQQHALLKAPAEGLKPPVARPGVKEAWGARGGYADPAPAPTPLVTAEQARDIWSTTPTPTPDMLRGTVTPRPPSKQVIRIREEWGFKDPRTAELMAKRSKRWGKGKGKRGPQKAKKQPLSKLLELQKTNAGVGQQHSKYDRVVRRASEHRSSSSGGGHSAGSRPETQQGYQWTHEKTVVHRGLVSSNGRASTVQNQVVTLPNITPSPTGPHSHQQQQPQSRLKNADLGVTVKLPQINGATGAIRHRYSIKPSSAGPSY